MTYNLVLNRCGEAVYEGALRIIRQRVQTIRDRLLNTSRDQLLQQLGESWQYFRSTIGMIRDILLYLEKTWVKNEARQTIYWAGMLEYHRAVLQHEDLRQFLREILIQSLHQERLQPGSLNSTALRSCLSMLIESHPPATPIYDSSVHPIDLTTYQEVFETPFLAQMRQFFVAESDQKFVSLSLADYLVYAESRLRQEESRCESLLDRSSLMKVKTYLQFELFRRFSRRIFCDDERAFHSILAQQLIDHLQRLYRFVMRDNIVANDKLLRDSADLQLSMLEIMSASYRRWIRDTGNQVMTDPEFAKVPPFLGASYSFSSHFFGPCLSTESNEIHPIDA